MGRAVALVVAVNQAVLCGGQAVLCGGRNFLLTSVNVLPENLAESDQFKSNDLPCVGSMMAL